MRLTQFYQRVRSAIAWRQQNLHATVLKYWLHLKSRPMQVSQKPAIVFAPHPDDETLGCGGMIALKHQQGVDVWVIFLTDGQDSQFNHARIKTIAELVQIRHHEALAALETLGVQASKIRFLDLPDGSLSNLPEAKRQQVVDQLVNLLEVSNAQEVYVTYCQDLHPDHQEACALVRSAVLQSRRSLELIQYPIWANWRPQQIDFKGPEIAHIYRLSIAEMRGKKMQALDAYRSQYLPLAPGAKPPLPPGFLKWFSSPYETFFKAPEQ